MQKEMIGPGKCIYKWEGLYIRVGWQELQIVYQPVQGCCIAPTRLERDAEIVKFKLPQVVLK